MALQQRVVDRLLSRLAGSITTRVTAVSVPEISSRVSDPLQTALRAEMVELTRMLRQQGDAADEVAETLGRTLARLSAEVDQLAEALAGLRGALEAGDRPGPAPATR